MRIRTLLITVSAAIVTTAGVHTPAGATGRSGPGTPGGEPLPPYTISNPPLTPVTIDGYSTAVYQGVHEHAAYIVERPPNWNGDLVMWAHGYRGNSTVLTVTPPAFGLRTKLLGDGYAWAASSYTGNGVDIASGVTSTRKLATHTGTLLGRSATRTIIAGTSLGGYVVGRSMEQYPTFYDGALSVCGGLGGQTMMDYFLDHNVVAQALAGVQSYPVPADYLTTVTPRIKDQLGLTGLVPGGPDTTNDLGKQLRSIMIEQSGGPRPGADVAFATWYDFLFQIYFGTSYSATPDPSVAAVPGQVGQNLFTYYTPDNPVRINSKVRRVVPADLAARLSPALTEVPMILGLPSRPVLSLHGIGDMYVPFSQEQDYRENAVRNGRGHLVVQRAIRTIGHCEFSEREVATAWDDLTQWVRRGTRPAGDSVDQPTEVARSEFGCVFSDPEAYSAGSGSRALFPRCP